METELPMRRMKLHVKYMAESLSEFSADARIMKMIMQVIGVIHSRDVRLRLRSAITALK